MYTHYLFEPTNQERKMFGYGKLHVQISEYDMAE
jgi:hypothetical protein